MSELSVIPGTFSLERTFPVSPARVFRAWSTPDEVAKWAAPASGWIFASERFEFTIGGQEISSFGPKNEEPFRVNSRFDDIVENARIVSSYSISKGDMRITSTVLSVELIAEGTGTRLKLTETSLFLDGHETPEMREQGTKTQLDQLEAYLSAEKA